MTVKDLKEQLEDYGDHLEIKVRLEENMRFGQYRIDEVSSGTDDEDGSAIAEIRI